jgi:hypothetical protein
MGGLATIVWKTLPSVQEPPVGAWPATAAGVVEVGLVHSMEPGCYLT